MEVRTSFFVQRKTKYQTLSQGWERHSTLWCLSLPGVSLLLEETIRHQVCLATRRWQCPVCPQSSLALLLPPPPRSTEIKPRSAGPSAPLRKKHLFPAFNQTKVLTSFIGKVSNEKQEIKQFNHFSLSSKVCRCPHVIKKKNLNSMDPTSVTTSCWDRWQQTDGLRSEPQMEVSLALLACTPPQFNHSVHRGLLI